MATTTGPKGRSREKGLEPSKAQRRKAAALVDEADGLVGEALSPGRWPQAKTVDRFLEDGGLERLLALYSRAMWLDASEPAYPWNLSSVLRRLRQNDLALAFLARAINTGERVNEEDYSGADAYLALAETAIDAEETDLAFVALARAQNLGEGREDVARYARQLLAEVGSKANEESPRRSLLRLLEQTTD